MSPEKLPGPTQTTFVQIKSRGLINSAKLRMRADRSVKNQDQKHAERNNQAKQSQDQYWPPPCYLWIGFAGIDRGIMA